MNDINIVSKLIKSVLETYDCKLVIGNGEKIFIENKDGNRNNLSLESNRLFKESIYGKNITIVEPLDHCLTFNK